MILGSGDVQKWSKDEKDYEQLPQENGKRFPDENTTQTQDNSVNSYQSCGT